MVIPRRQSATEEVVHKLAQEQRLQVITQSAAAWLEERDGFKPHYLLEGSVRRAGADVRLTLHLMELTGMGATPFSNIYQTSIENDIFATQEQLAEKIRGDLCAALSPRLAAAQLFT